MISFKGTILGPSEGALSGSSCVSIKIAPTPTAIAALERNGTNSLWPPLYSPMPPGCWTEWVASKTIG